jgi:hypothetical protein
MCLPLHEGDGDVIEDRNKLTAARDAVVSGVQRSGSDVR